MLCQLPNLNYMSAGCSLFVAHLTTAYLHGGWIPPPVPSTNGKRFPGRQSYKVARDSEVRGYHYFFESCMSTKLFCPFATQSDVNNDAVSVSDRYSPNQLEMAITCTYHRVLKHQRLKYRGGTGQSYNPVALQRAVAHLLRRLVGHSRSLGEEKKRAKLVS